MPMFDLPLAELESYRPDIPVPNDLSEFWQHSLDETRANDLRLSIRPVDNKLAVIDTYDVKFAGWDGHPVRAWLHLPAGRPSDQALPTVVQYLGYSRGRGFPLEHTIWAQAGWAHLVLDTRGQGWSTGGGSGTPDWAAEAGLASRPGLLTSGITDPKQYYYRRAYCDAVRLLEVARELEQTDADRLVVTGVSQGGGFTVAVAGLAALSGFELRGAAPDVPFLCHFQRAVEITDAYPYAEITEYLAAWRDHEDEAYRTLSYFDGAVLGRWATAPALFSVALMDAVCPPSTVYAAYHHYGGQRDVEKAITVYPHNGHEGGEQYQVNAQLDWFAERFAG
jgi:cephalosporin-C deacetylase